MSQKSEKKQISAFHNPTERGQLLLEILVAISALAVIGLLTSQLLLINMQSNKAAGEKNVGLGFYDETFETAKTVAAENWQNLYGLTKGSTNYYPQKSGGKWIFTQGSENIVINDITYTRSFTIQNVCRNNSTKSVTGITDNNGIDTTCLASGGSFDPSTQKINIQVSWPISEPISSGEYVTRWRNNICLQTSWQSSGSSEVKICPDTTYESSTNLTTGDALQINP